MNLLVLVVQRIVMSENICSRMTSTRSNNLDKLANLNDSIWCQLMQLYPELAQNIEKDWVRRHTETSNKETFEHHCFVLMRIWNILCTRRSVISFQKITSETLQRGNAVLSNPRLPKILADASKSSLSPNLHATTVVGGSFVIAGASRSIHLVRPSTLLRSGFCQNNSLLASLRFFQLLGRDLPMLCGSFKCHIGSH
jgi:hypothetical protein